ncbi:hypothetical protein ACFSTA_15530 [Ornithinibacillus salinisoli]|uniref:Uncharacterized protein n=1 Tax=Ornithinibacillus salinisoli TaxID=1848459 RepID=A0ABW4VZR4_9BACI
MEDKRQFKKQLDKELASITFCKQNNVLDRAYPRTWKDKIRNLWNKEVEVPLLPISAVCVIIMFSFGYKEFYLNQHQVITNENVLIEVAGNTYWKEDLERAMIRNED